MANWPAMRPTLTTGSIEPYVSTAAICRMIFSFSRMLTAEKSSNDSAQSPACSRKPRPAATCGQRLPQLPGLAGEHQRRHRGEPLARRLGRGRVGPVRLMQRVTLAPGGR